MMLDRLVKDNDLWLEFAKKTCKDYDLACDIVQEMYLYFSDKDIEYNKSYIYSKIFHLFIDYCRKESRVTKVSIEKFHFLEDKGVKFEPNDEESEMLRKYYELNWVQRELIEKHYIEGMSLRQIQEEFPLIKYGYAFRIITDAKNKLNE